MTTPYSEFISTNFILFAALGIILALILRMEIKRAIRGFKIITPKEAVMLINKEEAILIDVREDNELAQGFIRGSKHLSLSVLKQRVDELKTHSEKPMIAYCRTGNRSLTACEILKKNNFHNIMSLRGGLEAWRVDNLPVVKK
ncbi:MAG: rhodanese-like domain-containing protein [Gammaproteobacteria bacterium]|nr:rhodanese-like domain-containing protein [Gammaproteobacteria bacterium]